MSRLGRIALSTPAAARSVRGMTLATLISTTGMTITGPSRAGKG